MIERGPADNPEGFFDVMHAMLFCIDEFSERLHHPKESDRLFPRMVCAAPELKSVIKRLEAEHIRGEGRIREPQHQLLASELRGDVRCIEFTEAATRFVAFYREHMCIEETELLPVAQMELNASEWAVLNMAS